jgi:hypothetical protein
MTKKNLLQAANLMSLYSILTKDEVQAGNFKTSLQRDKILKYLSRIESLSNKIRKAMMEVFQ